MARRPAPSPSAVAIQRVAKLASLGTNPGRVHRDTLAIVSEWRAQQEPDIARRWIGELHSNVAAGLASAEARTDEVSASDAGAVKHMQAMVAALRAARDLLAKELARH